MGELTEDDRMFVHQVAKQGSAAGLVLMQRLGFDLRITDESATTALHTAHDARAPRIKIL